MSDPTPVRIYRCGDPEPLDDPVLLLENGRVLQRIGSRWDYAFMRLKWSEILFGDMVAVGVDLPKHPDPLAIDPWSLLGPLERFDPQPPSPEPRGDVAAPRTIGPLLHAPEGVVDVQLPLMEVSDDH